ncbi:MAG: hypothetical protein LBK29_04750 [Oscillospiraceae bacterium]|nr:hypothetical protein [Oscillospiraceae bacterium]
MKKNLPIKFISFLNKASCRYYDKHIETEIDVFCFKAIKFYVRALDSELLESFCTVS